VHRPVTQDFLDLIDLTSEVLRILPSLMPGTVTTITDRK